MARRTKKSKAARGLVTRTIEYRDRRYSTNRNQTLTVDVPQGEPLEEQQAAAMVTVRTGVPLTQVEVVNVTQP